MINPYKPSVLFVGHRQTVHNQIRRRMFSTEVAFKCKINMKNTTKQPYNWKWTRAIDKDGEIHLSKMS